MSVRKRNLSVESNTSINNRDQLKSNNHNNNDLNNRSINNTTSFSPPDGGWGWVVVFASFMINLISDGVSLSFGVIFMELVDYFGESKSKTAWVGSLFLSIPLITGPIASALTDNFGCRRIAICGSLMSASGFILGHFATKLEHLFIAFSISGFGLALCYVTSIVSVAYYFEKRRSLATGLAVCGTGFGTFLFAPLTIFLLNEYGWRGTLLILGAIFLNIVNFGALMRDLNLDNHSQDNTRDLEKDQICDNDCYSDPLIVKNKTINKIYSEDQSTEDERQQLTQNRLCSSLIHIPTYIRQNGSNSVSNEIISELSNRKGGYLRRLLQRYPKLIAFFMPQEYENNEYTIKSLPSTSNASNSSAKPNKPDNALIARNEKKIAANLNSKPPLTKTLSKKERNGDLIVKNSGIPAADFSPLSTNYLRNLRLQRGSLTYRSAMLNIRKYRLRASSAPDIYRNSMVAIDRKVIFLNITFAHFT